MEDQAAVVDLSAVEHDDEGVAEHEPLFTRAPLEPPARASSPPVASTPPAASPGYELPAILPELKVPPIVIGTAGERRSRIRGIRAWWRQESLARAAEKRALANAEAVLRAQAIQSASAPIEKAPTTEEQAGSMRSMLTLNEERFQSLGLRSDRLRDELVGIATSIADLRGLVASGASPVGTDVAAADLLGDLQGRFDSLLPALSEELGRRSEESERRISLLLSANAAELAAHLERAVERIGTALPATLPEEMQRIRELSAELEKVRSASDARLELIEANAAAKLERLRAENEQLERSQGSTGDELSRIREEIAGISQSIRVTLADVVPRSQAEPIVLPDASPR